MVPAGAGWTVDPFGGEIRDGRIWGRGACDMKAGIAAAVFAVEAIRRAGIELSGSVEISGTVDEESGGFAGVAWLAEQKRIGAHRPIRIIRRRSGRPIAGPAACMVEPRPLTDRARQHAFQGVNAIEHMTLRSIACGATRPALAAAAAMR